MEDTVTEETLYLLLRERKGACVCTGSEALRGVGVLALGSHQFPSHSPPAAADTRNLEFWEAPGIAGTLGWGVISRLLVLVTDLFSNHPLLSISAGAMLGLQPAGREPSLCTSARPCYGSSSQITSSYEAQRSSGTSHSPRSSHGRC